LFGRCPDEEAGLVFYTHAPRTRGLRELVKYAGSQAVDEIREWVKVQIPGTVEADGGYYLVVDGFAPGYPDAGRFTLTVEAE